MACNYDADATDDDGSCEYAATVRLRRQLLSEMRTATVYAMSLRLRVARTTWRATTMRMRRIDDRCEYAADGYDCDGNCLADADGDGVCDAFEVAGCQDDMACNYDADATDDDGSLRVCCGRLRLRRQLLSRCGRRRRMR